MSIKLCLISLAFLFLASCVENKETKDVIVKVKCEEVKSVSDIVESSTYPGKVSAAADVNLSFRVAGVIDKIVVKEGDFVRKDQIVAYMDNRDYKLQLDATQAEYDAIKAEVDRIIALYEDESVSANDYDKAVNGLKQITSKLAAHRNAYEDTNLKAPFDGYIQTVKFDKGEAVSAGMPIISYVSASAPELVIYIPVVEYLKRGSLSSATATVNSFPNTIFNLERVGVTHKANLNQLYEFRFAVKPEDGKYPSLGMSAMVTLNYEGEENEKVSIPFSAVVEKDGASYVWQLSNGVVNLKQVEICEIKTNGTAIIDNGISCGDIVVTAGVNSLKDGQRVERLSAPSKSNIGNVL
ncbi:MAG: efflux RND transporter periplasmic adaptor subunit [Rikenellaceae bacterium]